MLKTEVIEKVAKDAKLTKRAAKEAVESTFTAIEAALRKGDKVVFSGFGTFLVRSRRSRTGRNPKTGDSLQLPDMKTIGFIASKSLKKMVR